MPLCIGIDEAGYGPNLGPLVMTAVACRVPKRIEDGNLWPALKEAVRRPAEDDDGRLLVEDSKVLFSQAVGLGGLELSVLAILEGSLFPSPAAVERGTDCQSVLSAASETDRRSVLPDRAAGFGLRDFLDRLCPDHHAELTAEAWYHGNSLLPLAAAREEVGRAAARFSHVCAGKDVHWARVRSVLVCPPRFNLMVERWGSKAGVLSQGLTELLRWHLAFPDDEPVRVMIDKHGGRNHYSAMLQEAFDDGMVIGREEGALCSRYEVLGHPRSIHITFAPRADGRHFCVALASMISKYLREVLMHEFNAFWQQHVPGLKATAGYPGDADRFLKQILPALKKLGIEQHKVWRCR